MLLSEIFTGITNLSLATFKGNLSLATFYGKFLVRISHKHAYLPQDCSDEVDPVREPTELGLDNIRPWVKKQENKKMRIYVLLLTLVPYQIDVHILD